MIVDVIIRTPKDYDSKTSEKMLNSGLIRIEIDFEHDKDYSRGFFRNTRYVFNDCVVTCPKKFRKKVYNYE